MSSFWNLFSSKEEGKTDADTDVPEVEPPALEPTPVKPAPLPPAETKAPPQLPSKAGPPRYGIDDAIKLMRTLPVDENVDLVVRVIKKTLESLAVKVPDIIDDAGKRQEALKSKIAEYKSAIVQFEREIDARKHEINRLEDELHETTTVRERLQLAENTALTASVPPVKLSTAPATTPSAPPVAAPPVPGSNPAVAAVGPNKKYEPAPPNLRSTGSFRPKLGTDPGKGEQGKKQSVPPPPPPIAGSGAEKVPVVAPSSPVLEDEEVPVDSKDLEKSDK